MQREELDKRWAELDKAFAFMAWAGPATFAAVGVIFLAIIGYHEFF